MQNILSILKTFSKTKLFFLTVLFITIFVLYGKAINFDFINLDEDTLIENNITYLSNIKNIPEFFLTSCYFTKSSFYYRPLLTVSFCLETSVFGYNKTVYHFTNIILFILSLYLMYIFSLRLNINSTVSKFIILLFAVHPVFATLPVWVPARNDTLLMIFILLSFIKLSDYVQFNKTTDLILFILFFIFSLFTKESAIFLFILYPLFLYCFKINLFRKQNLYVLLTFFITVIIYFFLRNHSVAGISITSYFTNILNYLNNFVFGICNYIFFFFVPYKIPVMLLNETISYKSLTVFCLFTLIFTGFYYKNVKYRKILIFSAVWFLIFLIPTFFQKEYVFLTHRLFVASAGLMIFLSIFVEELILKFHILKKGISVLFIILFGCFFYISFTFQNTFSNRQLFWQQANIDAPNYHFVPYNLAAIYFQQNNYEKYKEFIFKAYKLKNGQIHFFNIVPVLVNEGQTDKVKQICFDILQNKNSKLFFKVGANIVMGELCLRENNLNQAYTYFKTASELDKMNSNLANKVKDLESRIRAN